jgi:hypothetical protein
MILGETPTAASTAATLDDLFRRAGVRHPDALALADPPNRQNFTDGIPRALSFAQADRAISAIAARLRGLGLQTDSAVAIQLPNIVESIVAFLGVLRAGMIPLPLPLLWRQEEIVSALRQVGVKAIIGCSRFGQTDQIEIAMQSAVELFSIRHVCGFGPNLPDGIVPLDDVFLREGAEATVSVPRLGPAAAHVAAITFYPDASGLAPIARSHVELVAGGLETFLETGAGTDTPTLSTIPIGSFAGIALTVIPWLLCGGALHLHHSFDPLAFDAQYRAVTEGTVILPAVAVAALAECATFDHAGQTVVALWRAPERVSGAKAWEGPSHLVDVASFGETGLIAVRRDGGGLPPPIPLGPINSIHRAPGAPVVIETSRTKAGTLALRGRMVPAQTFQAPPGQSASIGAYVDTGFACSPAQDPQTLVVTAPPSGTISVGGYCFRQSQIEAAVAQADPKATIVVLPDADLGQRLAGTAADREALQSRLQARGANPLLSGAFEPRHPPKAA